MAADCGDSPSPRTISRREFIKLAALAGLLAGCRSNQKLVAAPATAPTSVPTAIPTLRPLSTVVHARHTGVWNGDALVPGAIHQMLDASITALTGLDDVGSAWASLFDPGERIAIKVNTINSSSFWTHVPLVMAVTERLQEAGVPAEQIVIFDRETEELDRAGYSINRDRSGVRCYGTDTEYTTGWTVMDRKVGLSNILLSCDALINVPILKHHNTSGFTFAMKNHYGTFDRPSQFHWGIERAIPELNALEAIKDRIRLIIGDALTVCPRNWNRAVTWDSIFMSFDPVAHDVIALQELTEVMISEGHSPESATNLAEPWLKNSAGLGLGTNDLDRIELVEVALRWQV